jgi:hypothetical protein
MTLCIVGFDDLVTSFVAAIATGWSDLCRVGLPPTRRPRLFTAHRESSAMRPGRGVVGDDICECCNEKAPCPSIGRTTNVQGHVACSALPGGRQDVVSVAAAGKSVDVVGRFGEAWTKRVDETLQAQEQLLVACICRG